MSITIRLSRGGSKGAPFYKVVVADSANARDGRFIEKLGTFKPSSQKDGLNLDKDRVNYWLNVGAKPSKTVASLIKSK